MATSKDQEIAELRAEVRRLKTIINTPLVEEFFIAVKAEASHQEYRSAEYHDELKKPSDWFWLIGYLAGKALEAHISGDRKRALHHTISSAAVMAHWHQAIQHQMPPTQQKG